MAYTRLTKSMIDSICNDVKKGSPPLDAAIKYGLTQDTFNKFYEMGLEKDRDDIYSFFSEQINIASSQAIINCAQRIMKGDKNWRANAWWLNNMYPERFSTSVNSDDISESKSIKNLLTAISTCRDEYEE